ncbi:MAG: substrate-binding domain-containing protein [Bryobacteraceae bacterium]|nr:substrate-binding domain-containing protein [Bryobacteraceae bacterium]MDW8377297.1 substrate-binding domain-containing protein [Bryobacterales bacterium]
MRRWPCPVAFLLAAVLLSSSCKRDHGKTVGVVPKGANHIFWQTVHAGAIQAAREYGLEVEWNAPALEIDASRQIEIVESMVTRRLAGIALAPVDKKALVGVVERAARAGIPVSIFDSGIDTDKRICYVATNNEEGGRIAARRLGEILGGKGKVAVIGFMPGSASTMEREHGFQDEMRSRFPQVNLVALQFGMASQAKAMAATENVLAAHPDLAGLFADNESSSAGAVQALKSRGARQVRMVAFDASESLVADMKAGWIDSIVVQNPFRMGYEATRAIGMKLRGETPQPFIDSGARLVRVENLDEPAVKELLFPDLKRFLTPQRH